MSRIKAFLELAVKQGGSDLHLATGYSPRIRIHGVLHPVRFREFSMEDMRLILAEFMDARLMSELDEKLAVDFAYEVEDLGRFRVNAYHNINGLAAALRVIPTELRTVEELDIPPAVVRAIARPSGLTLVTGPTGSGKSTTLAAMLDHINAARKGHIITIEDPIEFVHSYKRCVITQREIGRDSPGFTQALRNALREDPDVILVGEMRDLETIGLAITAAETGIQVMGSLHTNGAIRTIDRVVNVFPSRRQEQVRNMLAESLNLIVSQQLVQNVEGNGRIAVSEVLINTSATAAMIRAGKSHQLASVIQSSAREGMQSLDTQLLDLVRAEKISGEEAYRKAIEKARFARFLTAADAA
jgi:twitching motility protein PilT